MPALPKTGEERALDIALTYPWALLLLPLTLVPFFAHQAKSLRYSSLSILPFDGLSFVFSNGVKLLTTLVILLLIVSLTKPYLKEQTVERMGKGAQIVILLDRSASMNENFAGRYFGGGASESKVAMARQLLSEFVLQRQDDFFGMISFSTAPIHVLPLTQDKEAILAAIRATKTRGRGVTNIAPGLYMGLSYFSDIPVTGSRVILLVSDGAAKIDIDTQTTLTQLFHQNRVMLYWVYLRNKDSARLDTKPANINESTTPEYFLHQYFQSMGIPYRSFEAENPQALQEAIKAIGELENKPIRYTEKIPRKDLAETCYLWTLAGLFVLLLIKYFEVKTEQKLIKRYL
jgi:mxaC protein